MNYGRIIEFDVTNGPGVRTTLFVSGCTHNCKDCFNREAQNFNFGTKWTKETEETFIRFAKNEVIQGISILGGEPFQQDSEGILLNLLVRLKEEVDKPIWVWTGYTFEEILKIPSKKQFLNYIDVLVDGKFETDKKDYNLMYKGSSNQRVIDVKTTLKENKIFLFTT